MTVNNNNASDKEKSTFQYVKLLNTMLQSDGEVFQLIGNVKEIKRKIDSMFSDEKDKIRQFEAAVALKEEERRRVEEETAKAKSEVEKPSEPALITAEEPSVIKEDAVTQKASKPPEPVVIEKKEPVTRTITPSYIRGVITPPPPRPQNTFPPRRPAGQGGNTGSFDRRPPRPFNNNNSTGATARPFNNNAPRPAKPLPKIEIPATGARKVFDKKKEFAPKNDDKSKMNKRTLIRKGFIQEDMDDERMGTRKLKNRKIKDLSKPISLKIEKAVITTENLTVKILSEKIGKTAQEIIKQLMALGIMTSINSVVDFPTMELVANELGVELELKLDKTKEEQLEAFHDVEADVEESLTKRPPIITVMGHVDHGKTSLLDAIRKTSVVTSEAGGITQHIGAYSVVVKNEKITFLDTPGHEAFTAMRARGAQVTDIAVLIVAADDGIMPQTVEAINHAKAANVPIVVAVNKIDKPGANVEKIKQTLTEYGLVCEEWGGDTMVVPISAKQGTNIDKLLENILLLAEVNNYRANADRKARGNIIEAKLDKGKGPVANIIVLNGTLRVGDFVVSGMTCGRVRAMVDDKGRNIKEAGPSTPVSILGFTDVPQAGDNIFVVEDEKMAKQVIDERNTKLKAEQANQGQKVTLDDIFNRTNEGQLKNLNVIVKADVQGSVEALKNALIKLVNEEVKVNVVHGGVGAINKSDLMLAGVSNSIIIGFNVRPDAESKSLAESTGVDIRLYRIIYEALEDIERAINGMVEPKFHEISIGKAEVRNVFKINNVVVAGSYVTSGKITRSSKVKIVRGEEMVYEGNIDSLKRFKDDVKEVSFGFECGISLVGFNEIAEGDIIEAFLTEEIKKG